MPGRKPTESLVHDISSAVFRVATLVRHKKLREELETAAIYLVIYLDDERVDLLERTILLSESIGEIGEVNSGVLCRELGNLRKKMSSVSDEPVNRAADIDINEFFIKAPKSDVISSKTHNVRAGDRQTAILEFIRQFPNDCRMKDLVAEFPGASERTLRSDVQKLIEENSIERLGGKSGPFSYFRALDFKQNMEDGSEPSNSILLPETTGQLLDT